MDVSLQRSSSQVPVTPSESASPLDAIKNLPIPVAVQLCHRPIKLRDFLLLEPGDVISFNARCDSPLELTVGGKRLATGNAIRQGTRLGLRLEHLGMLEQPSL